MMDSLTLIQPDDWHLHLRDGSAMVDAVADSARYFARAIVMPNLGSPVLTCDQALSYRQRILAALPGTLFDPLMTLYLTDNTTVEEIAAAAICEHVYAVKYYPAGATTNSDSGVTAIENVFAVLEAMQKLNLPLLVHGEVTDPDVDIFDREAVFIDKILEPLQRRFPDLRIVLEHVSTRTGVEFIQSISKGVAATMTAHHLSDNRNAMLAGGIRPHMYCLPVLKRESDRESLVAAATSGDARFFLGTDSAPHAVGTKETACGCAGIYTANAALEWYAEIFDTAGKLEQLEAFASLNGPHFYGLAHNTQSITLTRTGWEIPADCALGDDRVIPYRAGSRCQWTVTSL